MYPLRCIPYNQYQHNKWKGENDPLRENLIQNDSHESSFSFLSTYSVQKEK
jgi:hypothetical protein